MDNLNFGMIELSDDAIEALRSSGVEMEEFTVPLFDKEVKAVKPSGEPKGIMFATRFMKDY